MHAVFGVTLGLLLFCVRVAALFRRYTLAHANSGLNDA
jgi:hypothetical protein